MHKFGKENLQSAVREELCSELLERNGGILEKIFHCYRAQADHTGLWILQTELDTRDQVLPKSKNLQLYLGKKFVMVTHKNSIPVSLKFSVLYPDLLGTVT